MSGAFATKPRLRSLVGVCQDVQGAIYCNNEVMDLDGAGATEQPNHVSRQYWRSTLRLRRPPQSKIDQVHISRKGEYAIIEHANPAYGAVNLKLGPKINTLTNRQILEMFNDVIAAQEASIADPANRPIEIPKGRPQIEWLKDLQQWSARGHVLKCEVSDDEDGNLVVYVDDNELDAEAFLQLIRPFAGWGMRITFMDESQIHDEPDVILRDPDAET